MPEVKEAQIVDHLVDALEQLAFISPLPADGPVPAPAAPLLLRIGFRGVVCQRIEMLASEALGSVMAANILGPDSADAPFRARDALKELLNVACGGFLAAWPTSPAQGFRMSVPEIQPLEPSEWDQLLAQGGFTILDAEGHPLAIRIADRKA